MLSLAKDTSALASMTGLTLRKQETEDGAEALLTARQYLDFKSAGDLKGKAAKWLVQSPFDSLTGTNISRLDDMKKIRNYIAHRSRQSRVAYQQVLQAEGVAQETTPGEFLSQQTPTRLDTYLAELIGLGALLIP